VPTHKTGTAFTKPVDPILGQALDAWQAIRPAQPRFTDRRTGELVDLLFAFRARKISTTYINNTVIPVLRRKAGVPAADVRGNITSHRARSTIATQLYNAKEPMTLFELQAWLGHRNIGSTQHYAKITPNTLAKAYSDAGYFERNVRTIEVLVDREAVENGAAAAGEPWQYYDLGHGFCSYTSFERCPHRMACAKCDFYTARVQGVLQGAAAGGQEQPAAHARRRPTHRRREGCGRRRPRGPGQAALPARRRPHPGWPHPSPDRRPCGRDAPAHRRRQARPAPTGQRSMTPPGTYAVAAE
jgi:hypothetical protein